MSLNLGSTSQMVFVNVNEFGTNGTPRLDVKLPRRKINLGVNDTQSVSIQLNIPRYYPNLPSQKLISLEVQPKGNTLSGKEKTDTPINFKVCAQLLSSREHVNILHISYIQKPKVAFPFFISCYFTFFPNECPGLCRH